MGGGDVNAGDFCNAADRDDAARSGAWPVPQLRSDPPIRGIASVTVKGNLPLEADFSNWGLGDHLTLPDDWGRWAGRSRDCTAVPTTRRHTRRMLTNWDIHDDSLTTEGHVTPPARSARPIRRENYPSPLRRCRQLHLRERPAGRVLDGLRQAVARGHPLGPCDPIYPLETLLSDGKVDAGDAPMPAAQIDVDDHARTSGRPDRHRAASATCSRAPRPRSTAVTVSARHGGRTTSIAPFYSQYFPATARPVGRGGSPYGAVPGADGHRRRS